MNVGGGEWNEIDWIVQAAENDRANNFHRFEDWYREHQDQKQMEQEAMKVSTAYRQLGWTQGKMMKRIMSMPLHLFVLLRRVDPEFGRNSKEGKAKIYRFLQRHPEFTVR